MDETITITIIPCPKCKNQRWFLVQDITTHEKKGKQQTQEISPWYLLCTECFEIKEVE